MRRSLLVLSALLFLLPGCPEEEPPTDDDDAGPEFPPVTSPRPLRVRVLLDGEPAASTTVLQNGNPGRWTTDSEGWATITYDPSVQGEQFVTAAHPEARQDGVSLPWPEDGEAWSNIEVPLVIELTRYDASDNEDYTFRDPGEPGIRDTTAQCAHCHTTITSAYLVSPHRAAAKNPVVHDVYAGTASHGDQPSCEAAGGRWAEGRAPGTGEAVERCYLGEGVLPALNAGCGGPGEPTCDALATVFGGCADCHAPAMNGRLGGRDLLDARGLEYEYGVHCDVCHRVDAIDPEAPPGTGGRLVMTRPSEVNPAGVPDPWQGLMFGPYDDVPLFIMGSVQRDHFRSGELCSGCHLQHQPVLVPGAEADAARWPDGLLPVHTTYTEWQSFPLRESTTCVTCHMPPDLEVTNSADLQRRVGQRPGYATGWVRTPGEVARHSFIGPRQRESNLLEAAATVSIAQEVAAGELTATVTVTNLGAGHSIPTGEPLRSILLLVEASCEGEPLEATGGDAVWDVGGALATQDGGGDWSRWPGAQVGEVVRVTSLGAFRDYPALGPFGDGTFSPEAKGLPVEEVVGAATITEVDGDLVTFDGPLPEGDRAYRLPAPAEVVDEGPAAPWAGRPGFAFAKVMLGPDGARHVPHYRAVDVASDNRLPPATQSITTHRFASPCGQPVVTARLVHRAYPWELAQERGWELVDSVMVETSSAPE